MGCLMSHVWGLVPKDWQKFTPQVLHMLCKAQMYMYIEQIWGPFLQIDEVKISLLLHLINRDMHCIWWIAFHWVIVFFINWPSPSPVTPSSIMCLILIAYMGTFTCALRIDIVWLIIDNIDGTSDQISDRSSGRS